MVCNFDDLSGNLPGLAPGTPLTSVAIAAANSKELLVTASGFTGKHVFLSTNGGNSFSDVTGGLPDVPTLTAVIDKCDQKNSFVIGTDIGVFHTEDAGASWVNSGLGSLPNVPVYMLRQTGTGLIAATHGRGVWELPGCP